MFNRIIQSFARNGDLDADDRAELERYADTTPLAADEEDALRIYGGNRVVAVRVIGERIAHRRDLEARIRSLIAGSPAPENVDRLLTDTRNLPGRLPADIGDALGCEPWPDLVADRLAARLAPKPSRRVA